MGDKLKRLAAAAVIALICTPVLPQVDWINIAASAESNMRWDIQPGSLEFSTNKGGSAIAAVVGRITNTKTSTINLYKWYVSGVDCKKKMGTIVSLNISGEYLFENDFVFGSGSVATAIAETICGAADYTIAEKTKKSI
jgi:hypothetical protein